MGIKILGSTSGSVEISAPAVAGNNTQYTLGTNSGTLIGTNDSNVVDGNMLSSILDFKGKTLQSWPFGKNLEHAITYNYDVTAVTGAYVFGNSFDRNSPRFGNNVALTVYEGDTVNFNVNAPGHPFYLKTNPGTGTGNQIAGVTNNGADVGTVSYTFPAGSSGTYYYQCSAHAAMFGSIVVSTPSTGGGGGSSVGPLGTTPAGTSGSYDFTGQSMSSITFANIPQGTNYIRLQMQDVQNGANSVFVHVADSSGASNWSTPTYNGYATYQGTGAGGVGTQWTHNGTGTGIGVSVGSIFSGSGDLILTRTGSPTFGGPNWSSFSTAENWNWQLIVHTTIPSNSGDNYTLVSQGTVSVPVTSNSYLDKIRIGHGSGNFNSGYVRIWYG